MHQYYRWKDLLGEFRVFAIWAGSSIIDSAFIAVWVFLQWFVNEVVVSRFRLAGVDNWVLIIFQVLFAVSTVAPVVTYIYVDIRVMLLRAQRIVRIEMERNDGNGKQSQ